ncbi:MAG: type II toxin-antitoxin system VapC family toxin [Acidimicrobiales bacterium]|nr:hypothetical protein [Acidimicrobiaceae bacterium]MDE0676517.1 hypothetical protein [Acidimicrobiaceae bacterium]MXV88231.1 type II toxin-antitoxin system VapC family toxin [Acidimicrobiales bacterium]MYB82023.1 type II toxin-antitoxin system VapC family toxin [Acidimicrobiales bacterium]MYI13399.1 type II toxin-antitoxin system VapC family toxin [Acidimicrobiales bacterium]
MAPGPLLVDTDVFSFLRLRSEEADDFRGIVDGRLLVLSFATVGEVYFGAAKAGWGQRRLAALESALGHYTVLPGTREIARRFGFGIEHPSY